MLLSTLGDWIAFNLNFQPNLVIMVFLGRLVGGIVGVTFARLIAVPSLQKITPRGLDLRGVFFGT